MRKANWIIRICSVVLLTIIISSYFTYKWFVQELREEREKAPFAVTVLATGKSDCIVIETEGKVILVDSGMDKDAEKVIHQLKRKKINDIDYFILTHPDKDHIGGADKIIKFMNVKTLIHSTYKTDTKQYKQYMEASEDKKLVPRTINDRLNFSIGMAHFILYSPEKLQYEEDNDYSLVLRVVYEKTSFLFTGDAEEVRLRELMNMQPLHHTFLKVPHHGKYNEQTKEFLEKVNPKFSVITCSREKTPQKKTLDILHSLGSKTFLTSKGTVYCTSDGVNLKVTQEM